MPISCSPGLDCFIQNYFDHDPSYGWVDYSCGYLSYDGHTGTDFRLSGMEAMHKGVAVMAAANGEVVGLRDGEPDVSVMMRSGNLNLSKYAAGNAVRINHGDGWETQYSHMLRGSVTVRVGQRVRAGDQLGRVGLSGNTAFPHMEFTVTHNYHTVDPFAPSGNSTCVVSADSLWTPKALKVLRYIPTGILLSGWSDEEPDWSNPRNGEYTSLGSDAATIIFWVEIFGVQTGDRQIFEMFGPQGDRLLINETAIPNNKSVWLGYAGIPRPLQGWATGAYRAEYRLERNGIPVVTTVRHLEIR